MNKLLLIKTATLLGIAVLFIRLNAQVTIDSVRHGDALRGTRTGVAQIITNGNFEYPSQPIVYWGGSSNNNNGTPGTVIGTNDCGSNRYGIPIGTITGWTSSVGGPSAYPRVDSNANSWAFAVAPTGNGGHNVYFGNAGTFKFANNTNKLTYDNSTGLVSLNGNSIVQDPAWSGAGYGTTPVTLSQTFTVVPGAQYLVDFFVSGESANCGSPNPPGIFQFEIGNQVMYAYTGNNTGTAPGVSERYYVYFRSTSSSVTLSFKNWGHFWLDGTNNLLDVFPTYTYTGCHGGTPFSWCPYLTSELVLDDVVVNSSIPLPLSVEKFAAKKTGVGNEITWRAYDEEKIKQFNVLVSENGRDFRPLQTLNAGRGNYFFADKNLYKGIVYYKLNAEYYTGKEEMSGIAFIKNELAAPSTLTLNPNPASESLSAHCEVPLQKIVISSTTGQTLKVFNTGGSYTDYTLNIADLNKGIYLCQWIGTDGSSTSKLFIKQ